MKTDQPQPTGQTDEEQLKLLQDMVKFIESLASIPPNPSLWPLTQKEQSRLFISAVDQACGIENTAAYKWLKVEIAAGRLKRMTQ